MGRQIGIRLTNVAGYETAAVDFVRRVCFVTRLTAETIVAAGDQICLYPNLSLLGPETLPFTVVPVEAQPGWNVISTSALVLELPYMQGSLPQQLRLPATAARLVDAQRVADWNHFQRVGLIRFIEIPGVGVLPDFKASDFLPRDFNAGM